MSLYRHQNSDRQVSHHQNSSSQPSEHQTPKSQISRRAKLRLAVATFAVAIIGAVTIFTPRASAANLSSIVEKSRLEAVYQCYSSGQMFSPITSNAWDGMFSMVSFGSTYPIFEDNALGAKYVSCGELFRDYYAGKFPSESASVSTLDTFFKNMGYTISSDSSAGLWATYNFKNKDNEKSYVQMCAADVQNGEIKSDKMEITYSDGIAEVVGFDSAKGKITLDCNIGYWIDNIGKGGCSAHKFSDYNNNFDQFANGIFVDISNAIAKAGGDISRGSWSFDGDIKFSSYGESNKTYKINNSAATAANSAIKYLSDSRYTSRAKLALTTNEKQDLLLNYIRNYYGINYYLGSESAACNLTGDALSRAQAATEYKQVNLSTTQTCFITAANNRNNSVPTYNSSSYPDGTQMNFTQIIEELNKLIVAGTKDAKEECTNKAELALRQAKAIIAESYKDWYTDEMVANAQKTVEAIEAIKNEHGQYWYEENGTVMCYSYSDLNGQQSPTDPGYTPPSTDDLDTPDSPDSPDAEVASLTACYENAGVLGWIACPVLEVVGGMVEGLYEYVENNFLQIKSSLVNSDGIQKGWSIFRDFANLVFVALFAIIILSQLTGIGVSNYGIKKVLPRLIAIVVLVNVSFIICQLAVDISNIVGSGLRGMFEGFASQAAIAAGGVPFNLGTVAGGITMSLFTIGAAATVTAVLAFTIPWELWLFPILLTFLGCLISIFFFFILLGVRQAGVIILITLAPVAIVCYALPNTKTFFDRWKKLFTALLLVYPICGLLMGGGQFASTLLLIAAHETGDAGAFFTVVAMLLQVVPFFFVPSILKSSMAAMGNLGMKISNFGSRLGTGITRGIRNSEMGRDIQRSANMRYLDRAGRKIENQQGKLTGRVLKGWKQKRLGRYNTAYNRYSFEDIRAGGASSRIKPGSAEYNSLVQGQKSEQFDKDVAGRQSLYKDGLANSIVTSGATVNGNDEDAMIAELDEYMDRIITGVDGGATAESLSDDLKNAQAIINTLSDTGRGSTMAKVEGSFLKALQTHGATMDAATGDKKAQFDKSFGALGTRTNKKYGAAYKKNSPGAAAMFGDISKGQYGRAGTIRNVTELENDGTVKRDRTTGAPITHLASSTYSRSGLSGINPDDLSKMKAHHHANILDGIEKGDIAGSDALDLVSAADEVLAHPEQFATDADAKAYIERIRNAALASSTIPTGGTRTTGGMALGRASSGAINDVLNSIQGAQNWGSLSADEQTRYGQLVANIHDSLNNDMHTTASADQLKQALSIARSKGFVDTSTGSVVGEFTGAAKIKIPHGQKPKVDMDGWARDGSGHWFKIGQTLTPELKVKLDQAEAHNNQIDFDNGKLK